MLEITIKEREDRIPIEAECLTPDRLTGMSNAEVEKLPILHGNRQVELAEFFSVQGESTDGQIRLRGNWSTVKWVGAQMTKGHLEVDGDVGMHLGAEMSGGKITVRGDAGDWVGAEMSGGHIQIHGSAGHLVGGAYRGSSVGMTGGTIFVHGNAGNEVGGGMRRGWIAIGGDCGDFAAVSMTAGSLFVFGQPGIRFGAGMKRGTIALFGLQADPQVLPTFQFDCTYSPSFLQLYLRKLEEAGFPVPRMDYLSSGQFKRYNGDLLELGKGEVLAWQATA